jgi:hypothetical protein
MTTEKKTARVHPKEVEWHFNANGNCSYCGSMSPRKAITLLTTDGTQYKGSDWKKYGWPHEFLIGGERFFSVHLVEATEEEFWEFSELCATLFGIHFMPSPRGVYYCSVAPNFYTWGTIGQPPAPGAPPVPKGRWWDGAPKN